MARFELLLEQTSRQIDRESVVVGVAKTKTRSHRRRTVMKQGIKIAAVIALLGLVISYLWPVEQQIAQVLPTPIKTTPPAPPRRILPTSVVMHRPTTPDAGGKDKPLSERLDNFYLTSINFDKVHLHDAVRLMREQLKLLNASRRAEFDRLFVAIPAEASMREITFHAGSISFLKALRAIGGLANCDLQLSEAGLSLASRPNRDKLKIETRSVNSIMADNKGAASIPGALLAYVLTDARALGIELPAGTDFSNLTGTVAQFDALDLMLKSRSQINDMPKLRLIAFPRNGPPTSDGRVLTEQEANDLREEAKRQGITLQPIVIKPSSDELTTEQLDPNAKNVPDVYLVARPVGDSQWVLTLLPTATDPTGMNLPIDAIVGEDQGFMVRVTKRPGTLANSDFPNSPTDPEMGPRIYVNAPNVDPFFTPIEGTGQLAFGGNIPTVNPGPTVTQQLNVGGTGDGLVFDKGSSSINGLRGITVSADSTDNWSLGGANRIIKNGMGTVALNGNGTYAGGTTISGGVVDLNNTNLELTTGSVAQTLATTSTANLIAPIRAISAAVTAGTASGVNLSGVGQSMNTNQLVITPAPATEPGH